MIKFQNVTKTYKGSTVALQDCSVEIDKGEFVFLVGPSGSGKTTFIRLLLREEMPDSGRIWEAGKEIGHLAKWRIPYLRRNIGCVFQDFRLLPNKTVFENVAFALEVIGRPKHVIASQVPQVLDLVGLAKKRDNLPNELSGGEQQRVAVARAFVNRPLILLADEPTGNLDPKTSLGIMRLLDQINRTGTTVIIATHDAGMVNQMRRRVIELDRGIVVRDQAHGVYDIDSTTLAGGAGSPTGNLVDQMPTADDDLDVPGTFVGPSLMAISPGYVSKEAATNLWRNRLMTAAAILTVAVSLALVGSALLLKQGASKATELWQNGVQTIVWVQPTAGPAQINGIKTQLHQSPYVKTCVFRSQAYDYNEAKSDPAGRRAQRDKPSRSTRPRSGASWSTRPRPRPSTRRSTESPGCTTSSTRASRSRPCRA